MQGAAEIRQILGSGNVYKRLKRFQKHTQVKLTWASRQADGHFTSQVYVEGLVRTAAEGAHEHDAWRAATERFLERLESEAAFRSAILKTGAVTGVCLPPDDDQVCLLTRPSASGTCVYPACIRNCAILRAPGLALQQRDWWLCSRESIHRCYWRPLQSTRSL